MKREYYYWIGIFILFIIIGIIIYVYNNKNKDTDTFVASFSDDTKYKCVCVFDIDDTLTCGDAKQIINKCKKENCKFFINTARPVKYFSEAKSLGLGNTNLNWDTDFYFNKNSYSETPSQRADYKVKVLDEIQKRLNISKQCILFFDDNTTNITKAKQAGYTTILASHEGSCGLQDNRDSALIDIFLERCKR